MELTVDREFSTLIPPPTPAELAALLESLQAEGCREKIVVWANHNDIILDGHTRYRLCAEHEIPFQTRALAFATRDEARNWIINNQLSRRNISDETRSYLMGKVYREVKGEHGGDRNSGSSAQLAHLKTADEIAAKHGVNQATVRRAEKYADAVDAVAEAVGEEIKEAILEGAVKATTADLKALAEAPAAVRKQAAKRIKAGEVKSVKEAMKAEEKPDPEPEPEPPPPKLLDGENKPVPDKLADVFEARKEFEAAGRKISLLLPELRKLANGPGGEYFNREADAVIRDLKALRYRITANGPHAVVDRKPGWVSLIVWKGLPPEQQGAKQEHAF